MREFSPPRMLLPVQYTVRQSRLYVDTLLWRGAAATRTSRVLDEISSGKHGHPIEKRLELLVLIFEFLEAEAALGTKDHTIRNFFVIFRMFYVFVDRKSGDVEFSNVREWFKAWVESLYQRVRLHEMNERVVYHQGKTVAGLLSRAMEVPFVSIAKGTRLKKPRKSKQALGAEADKQNLAVTQSFGIDLLDIVESLSFDRCMGPLPIPVRLQSTGQSHEVWCGLQPAHRVLAEVDAVNRQYGSPKIIRAHRNRRSLEPTLEERYSAINMRICAEFLIFVAQTGMNKAQAMALTLGDFRYESILDGYAVRKYKDRKKGEVEFEIYSEYRPYFERYLDFRCRAIPEGYSELLFPVFARRGDPPGATFNIENVRRFLAKLGRPFISPQSLRGTRVNWLARAVGNNALVAQMAQHDVATLERIYLKPNHQVAAIEWTAYFKGVEGSLQEAPAPGACESPTPARAEGVSEYAPEPDCRNAAGCLFCDLYRGIDSLDYAWSMFSFRTLKRLELAKYKRVGTDLQTNTPLMVIERINDILTNFASRSDTHAEWTAEAEARCQEDDYHPRWAGFILLSRVMS